MIHCELRSALSSVLSAWFWFWGIMDSVEAYLQSAFPGAPITVAIQAEQLGTAHAVMCARDALNNFVGDVFILSGDVPTLPTSVIKRLDTDAGEAAVAVLGMRLSDPAAYGRLVGDADGHLTGIVEAADCSPEQLAIDAVNAGVYRVDAEFLFTTSIP